MERINNFSQEEFGNLMRELFLELRDVQILFRNGGTTHIFKELEQPRTLISVTEVIEYAESMEGFTEVFYSSPKDSSWGPYLQNLSSELCALSPAFSD